MNAKELAEMLDGAEYPLTNEGVWRDARTYAKNNGLVIVQGTSDDLTDFDGAMQEEESAYEGTTHWLTGDGLYPRSECDEGDRCPNYTGPSEKNAVPLKAIWCGPNLASWEFEFPVAHETFRVMEGDEVYCIGIVFALADVAAYLKDRKS